MGESSIWYKLSVSGKENRQQCKGKGSWYLLFRQAVSRVYEPGQRTRNASEMDIPTILVPSTLIFGLTSLSSRSPHTRGKPGAKRALLGTAPLPQGREQGRPQDGGWGQPKSRPTGGFTVMEQGRGQAETSVSLGTGILQPRWGGEEGPGWAAVGSWAAGSQRPVLGQSGPRQHWCPHTPVLLVLRTGRAVCNSDRSTAYSNCYYFNF